MALLRPTFVVGLQRRSELERLLAFEDVHGAVLGLGIVLEDDQDERRASVHTPLASLAQLDVVHVGDLLVDPDTFVDRPIGAQ